MQSTEDGDAGGGMVHGCNRTAGEWGPSWE